jgi:hypothetical protein
MPLAMLSRRWISAVRSAGDQYGRGSGHDTDFLAIESASVAGERKKEGKRKGRGREEVSVFT